MSEILAISPPGEFPDEPLWIARLLEAGLTRYHLRKQGWTVSGMSAFLEKIPEFLRGKIVLHQHHELIAARGLGGWHFKDNAGLSIPVDAGFLRANGPVLSRSLHNIENLDTDARGWDAVLLSPIFPSFSKKGYRPRWTEVELLRRMSDRRLDSDARMYALGGIHAGNAARCLELGFDGVVLHGALWRSDDPLAAYETVREVLR